MIALLIAAIERIDDIPLLLAQMRKLQLAELLDNEFPMHGNWEGLSLGNIVQVWLAYILSEGDHRLNHVESWAEGLLVTLKKCLGRDVVSLDFSDDRLSRVVDFLGQDEPWDTFEGNLGQTLIRVYDLRPKRARIDSTTAKSYTTSVTDGGIFQFGHSKDHRPDLPQLKINQSALDPLGIPLTTTIVSGEKADDPLYIPEISKVQKIINAPGVLFVGDCKMASMDTRTYVAKSGDYYLCPLSAVQMPASTLTELLIPVWNNEQALNDIYRPTQEAEEKQEKIAEGFQYTVTLQAEKEGEVFEWDEQRLVVHSLKHAAKQEKQLAQDIDKAIAAIAQFNKTGRGIKRLNQAELEAAVNTVLKKHNVSSLIQLEYSESIKKSRCSATAKQEAYILVERTPSVSAKVDPVAWEMVVRNLGWRVFVCNDKELTLSEAVLAYRQEYLIEHGFARYKGKTLGLTPIYLSSGTRVKGLIRLLSIGLRVLCLLEFSVREALKKKDEKLSGIYKGNPKRSTNSPTAEKMLKVFRGLSLIVMNIDGVTRMEVTPLNPVQEKILMLLEQPKCIYTELYMNPIEPTNNLSER
ncbi:MAG: IS1634 family transposase [Gammaproteobacteria bacterium]|nr:IS1634 family transposase [Gammaproteobacteria bacterium]